MKQVVIKRKIKALLAGKKELEPSKIYSLGVIVDIDEFPDWEQFLNLKNQLFAKEIQVVKFSNSKKKLAVDDDFFFNPADIGLTGTIKKGRIKEFAEKDFDLLINYTKRSINAFQLLTVSSRARFKVGIAAENDAFYDLILKTKIEEVAVFKLELIKYLKILKLLNNE